ncbi:MAG: radical SAM protein, partial [Candidatus Micrarchaeota archaeon]
AYDTAKLAREKKLYNVFVTNGYMTPETIAKMDVIDASRIDLKAFTEKFYRDVCGNASLEPVLKSIKLLHAKQHIELITLLIPTLNDSNEELRALSKWVANVDKNIPLHFTAYYPSNKMMLPPTPKETLERARKIAMEEGVRYVYTGNAPGEEGENTYCPNCGELLIRRNGFSVLENALTRDGKCPECAEKINVITKIKKV